MRRDQVGYFIYPFLYFIVRTVNQWRKHESIAWGENVTMLVITMVFIYFFVWMWNWSKKPYQWGKKTNKET
ncbi:hypothetical protein M5J14_00270 [Lysinibacillus sp. OL1_EC]|uniref:hypothetical protein n=1 Tax=unclassified Lysinibacillus TaxID=2636778 RepID=UPI00103D19A4|nr:MULTISPECIES: hypothetical protein [unclassified Lysinibacillus]MCM0622951.1 hypothetical protein [Lysinibacillus sp. OL1_EC]MCS5499643.1 hypothetical protein [Lysinibacillus sp. A4]TBV90119.1 hypothetical protein EW028_04090 [Lysinibacillus sp. OL1]